MIHAVDKITGQMQERRQIYEQVTELIQQVRAGTVRPPSGHGHRKLWTTFVTAGDSVAAPSPGSARRQRADAETGCVTHTAMGTDFPAIHQGEVPVVHNPQALLPLLPTCLSSSLIRDWGHSRKDKLR